MPGEPDKQAGVRTMTAAAFGDEVIIHGDAGRQIAIGPSGTNGVNCVTHDRQDRGNAREEVSVADAQALYRLLLWTIEDESDDRGTLR